MAEQVTPPPAPATKPSSSPPPTQSEISAQKPLSNPFAEIDALFDEKPSNEPASEAPAEKATEKPAQKPPAKPAEKAQQKPAEKASEAKPETPNVKALREQYESSSKRIKQLEEELEKAKKPAEDPERKTLQERLETVEKRREELENEIRFAAYERSQDYKDNYETPLRRALESGHKLVENLKITDANGNEVPGNKDIFTALCRMEYVAAKEQAKALFGEDWPAVMQKYEAVISRKEAAEGAISDYREKSASREQEMATSREKAIIERNRLFKQFVDDGIEKHPDLFKPSDEDVKGKELMTKGMALADAAFGSSNGRTPQEQVAIHAAIRNKAGGYDYLAYKWRQAEKRVKELEQKLSEFESSSPGEGSGKRLPETKGKSWEDEIDALAVG